MKMNGELKNNYFNSWGALAIGLVLSSLVLGWSYSNAKKEVDDIEVTGSARKRIRSDSVFWSAGVSTQAAQLADAYRQISEQVPRIKKYLVEKGIPEEQITISAVSTTTLKRKDEKGIETGEIMGYLLRQQVDVASTDVDKVARISREATELINSGILLESSAPQFYYTKLGDLKIEMLGEAARDAKTRADRIAESTGNRIGSIRSARMGVMQITAPNSTEVSDYGVNDIGSIDKDVQAVVNATFAVN